MRSFSVGLLFGFLIAFPARCTVVSHAPPVEGWPVLAVAENKVDHKTMRDHCQKYAPFGSVANACAEINLTLGTCTIWYVYEEDLIHERLHCKGHDHTGGTTLQELYQTWMLQK